MKPAQPVSKTFFIGFYRLTPPATSATSRLLEKRSTADASPVDLAAGVVAVVDAAMEQAVRMVSVARGVDPRDLALVAFGGAGPLHACAVADALDMAAVIVPPRAGVLSAVGLLTSPRQRDVVRSWPADPADVAAAAQAANGGGVVIVSFDCRYDGQSHELNVPTLDVFPDEHRRRNGYARPGAAVEVVAVRATARRDPPVPYADLPAPEETQQPEVGPAVLAEPDCTVWVPEGWRAEVGGGGSWILRRSRS